MTLLKTESTQLGKVSAATGAPRRASVVVSAGKGARRHDVEGPMEVVWGNLSLQNDTSAVRQNGGPISEAPRQNGGQRGLDMRIVKGAS